MHDDIARTLLGRQVEVRIGDEEGTKVIARGKLVGFGDGGDFEILCDDGLVHYCWPMLEISATDENPEPKEDCGCQTPQ